MFVAWLKVHEYKVSIVGTQHSTSHQHLHNIPSHSSFHLLGITDASTAGPLSLSTKMQYLATALALFAAVYVTLHPFTFVSQTDEFSAMP